MALFKSFGEVPSGTRQGVIEKSSNYRNGVFQNSSRTLLMAENSSMLKNFWKFLKKPADTTPSATLPSVKTDLRSLSVSEPVIVWFGHSSYFIRISDKNILVDPVLSGNASPFTFGVKSFPGSDVYSVDDFPDIDILLLTHDHYDHLDSRTVLQLRPKVKQVCASLGVGSHLAYWGFDENIITELDWWESKQFPGSIELTAAPARHFSGRSLNRNKTLWSSFVLNAPGYQLYLGGDSGYDSHFKSIGDKFGPFDIAILECGQYNLQWPQIHMMPEETVQAAIDLNAKILFPVHWSKFSLALHPWSEPAERVSAKAKELNVKITTPIIGEPIILNKAYPDKQWWVGI